MEMFMANKQMKRCSISNQENKTPCHIILTGKINKLYHINVGKYVSLHRISHMA